MGNIELLDRYDYTGLDGKRYLVIHGDFFDSLMLNKKWLMHIGDTLYDLLIWINIQLNTVRNWFGFSYWSLSKFLKQNTKQAVNYINKYEHYLADYCKKKGYDGIVCGHIHTAEIKEIDDIIYMNDGDWVDSSTALVEHLDGTWELIHYEENSSHN